MTERMCRHCGKHADYHMATEKSNRPKGWYCKECIIELQAERLKMAAKILEYQGETEKLKHGG